MAGKACAIQLNAMNIGELTSGNVLVPCPFSNTASFPCNALPVHSVPDFSVSAALFSTSLQI